MHLPKPRIWHAVTALVIALTLVAVYVVATAAPKSASTTKAIDAGTLPTAAQAWDTHGAITSIALGKDMTFAPTDIAPDGTFVVGLSANAIAMFTVATGKVQTIVTAAQPQTTSVNNVVTDGRYIAWV